MTKTNKFIAERVSVGWSNAEVTQVTPHLIKLKRFSHTKEVKRFDEVAIFYISFQLTFIAIYNKIKRLKPHFNPWQFKRDRDVTLITSRNQA